MEYKNYTEKVRPYNNIICLRERLAMNKYTKAEENYSTCQTQMPCSLICMECFGPVVWDCWVDNKDHVEEFLEAHPEILLEIDIEEEEIRQKAREINRKESLGSAVTAAVKLLEDLRGNLVGKNLIVKQNIKSADKNK